MNTNEEMHDRLRRLLAGDGRLVEKRMFGGLGFMLNGNMALGVSGKGELMVRLGRDGEAAARHLAHAAGLDLQHRMGGMLFVPHDAAGEDEALKQWVTLAIDYTLTLPAR